MAESNSNFADNAPTVPGKNSKRKNRNESEKRRRDTFNQLIAELTSLVAKGNRKMDKSSVLKCAINFLKQQHFQAESTSDEALNVAVDSKLRITTGCSLPEIVHLYLDALAAGTFCMQCSGHIEHASTSFATLFDDAICELQGKNLFDLLDDASAKSFSGALSVEALHSTPNTAAIQKTVTTKKLRRQLLISGYLRKITNNRDCQCMPDTVTERGTDSGTTRNVAIAANESVRFVGVIVPLSNRPESEVTLERISSWERRNANFTVLYNTEFVCIDAEGCQLLGYSRVDLLGTSGYDYIHVDDLLQVAESHAQLIKLGTYQVRPHRLQTKSHQWIWVDCTAVISGSHAAIKEVRCNYRVISMENVKKFKETTTFVKAKSIEVLLLLSAGVSSESNSLNPHCATNVVNTAVCPLSVTSTVGNDSASFSTVDDSLSERANDSVSVIASEKRTNESCTAKIVIEPLPSKRIRKEGSNEPPDNIQLTSFGYTLPFCQQPSATLSSPSSEALSSKRRSHVPLAFIEHYPLPDSKLTTAEVSLAVNSNESCINMSNLTSPSTSTSTVTPKALSISPMYQQVWEELQHRSEILRQQVLQKEMELRELHLKRFLASLHGDAC